MVLMEMVMKKAGCRKFLPIQLGRGNASSGLLLKFKTGKSAVYKPEVPVWLSGDIGDVAIVKFKMPGKKVIVSRNNDNAGVYELMRERVVTTYVPKIKN
jgi:hypothetical protein